MRIMWRSVPVEDSGASADIEDSWYAIAGRSLISSSSHGRPMHVAQFVHRYPPALGGAEAYTARLCEYLARSGDCVRVWTTTAVGLEALWSHGHEEIKAESPGAAVPGLSVRRYPPLRFPGRRYLLKALALVPVRWWQCLTAPCNPVCPGMWRDAGRYAGPLDAVHATAFPYSFPILCGLRLARRRGVPFFLTPFLHLG